MNNMTTVNTKLIKRWMNNNVNKFLDDCNEINATALAENAAQEFDLYEGRDYKIPNIIFDLAAQVAIETERRAS